MESHFKLNDVEFEQQFEKCTLDPNIFTHEAHLRLAWIHINKYGFEKAQNTICDAIFEFVKTLGAADKFDKTLTLTAVKVVYHFMKKTTANNFLNFIHTFPELKSDFRTICMKYIDTK